MTQADLNACGCCEGLAVRTPTAIDNRAGLSAIAYRSGKHSSFKQTMLARLSGASALGNLTTRADDDAAIALLDAWATTADVLTFYNERIANEAYLRTATERRSLLELGRLIGYELRPGVAASTVLAFRCEEVQGVPPVRTTIPSGTKVQSVPEPGEQPQLFETIAPIEARGEWNTLRPRQRRPHPISTAMNSITVPGLSTNAKPGDTVLIVEAGGARAIKRVLRVVPDPIPPTTRIPDPTPPTTRIELDSGSPPVPPADPTTPGQTSSIGPHAVLNSTTIQTLLGNVWAQDELGALATTRRWSIDAFATALNQQTSQRTTPTGAGVFLLNQRAALFGYNAPLWTSLSAPLRFGEQIKNSSGQLVNVAAAYPSSWEGRTLATDSGSTSQIFLDTTYPNISSGSWIVLESSAGTKQSYKVQNSVDVGRSAFAISAKVSRLTLDAATNFSQFELRSTAVLAQSERLELADVVDTTVVQHTSIVLDRADLGLQAGRQVVVAGERADLPGVTASEVVTLGAVTLVGGFTRLHFTSALAHSYVRSTATINANVAPATHGESAAEVLGSGDGRQTFQRFALRQPPLTYLSAATASGAASTLEVRVNDVLWHEVPTLFGHGPDERIFTTRTDDEDRTVVQFGDGITGARLPTGVENVRATYRKGLGAGGMVKAEQLSLLMTRPLGVREAINPQPAEHGADGETRDEARLNLPLAMLALDRIVSLQDYEDFARAFTGISKARATWTWDGQRRGVFVTVAGTNGATIAPGSTLHSNLIAAIGKAGDPAVLVQVQSYEPALFKLAAGIKIDPDREDALVLDAVGHALRTAFAFAARHFGQHVLLSEVIALIQHVPGVVAVNVSKLYRSSPVPDAIGATPPPRLVAAAPRSGDNTATAAELLTLDPGPLTELGTLA